MWTFAYFITVILLTTAHFFTRSWASTILPIGFFGVWDRTGLHRVTWLNPESYVELPCHILRLESLLEQYKRAKLVWLKNDKEIESGDHQYEVDDGGTLKFNASLDLSLVDKEEYRCLLRLKVDNVNYVVSAPPLTVAAARIDDHVKIVSEGAVGPFVKGSAIRLSCDVITEPPASVKWSKDGEDVIPDLTKFIVAQNVLQILDSEMEDSGEYKCKATNEILNKTKISEALKVTFQETEDFSDLNPEFLFPTRNIDISRVEGRRSLLECIPKGVPRPTVKWVKKGDSKDPLSWKPVLEVEKRVFIHPSGILLFTYVLPEDAGIYSCIGTTAPRNGEAVSFQSKEFKLSVIRPPGKFRSFPQNMTVQTSITIRLNCTLRRYTSISGLPNRAAMANPFQPFPTIKWYKNGIPLQSDVRIVFSNRDTEVAFYNTDATDTGIYQCIVSNEAGYSTAWGRLVVNTSSGTPPPPMDLSYTLLKPTSVLVKWKGAFVARDPILAYSLHWSKLGASEMEDQFVTSNTSFVLENLELDSKYYFYLRAYSSLASEPSEKMFFTTSTDVPNFHVSVVSPSSVLVIWQSMETYKERGNIRGYVVQWKLKKNNYYTRKEEVGPETTQYLIQNLLPGRMYKVSVLVIHEKGYEDTVNWPWETITLPEVDQNEMEGTPLPLPPYLDVEVVGSTDIFSILHQRFKVKVTYGRNTADSSEPSGYELQFKEENSNTWGKKTTLKAISGRGVHYVENLEPGFYSFRVSALNSDGLKSYPRVQDILVDSSQTSQDHSNDQNAQIDQGSHTRGSLPIIEHLALEKGGPSIVYLHWKVGSDHVPATSFYTIRVLRTNDKHVERLVRSTETSITLHDLDPSVLYEFSVRAHVNRTLAGPYSQPVTFAKMDSRQEPKASPLPPKLEPLDTSTMELSWYSLKTKTNKFPAFVEVLHSQNKNAPSQLWHSLRVNGTLRQALVPNLVSNTEYWFRIRTCSADGQCGPLSAAVSSSIPAVLKRGNDTIYVFIIAGVSFILLILLFIGVLIVYLKKGRPRPRNPTLLSRGHGQKNTLGDVSDLSRDSDYMPMLSRVHAVPPSAPSTLDTKGVDDLPPLGAKRPKCNGLVRFKPSEYRPEVPGDEEEKDEEEYCEEKVSLFDGGHPRGRGFDEAESDLAPVTMTSKHPNGTVGSGPAHFVK